MADRGLENLQWSGSGKSIMFANRFGATIGTVTKLRFFVFFLETKKSAYTKTHLYFFI